MCKFVTLIETQTKKLAFPFYLQEAENFNEEMTLYKIIGAFISLWTTMMDLYTQRPPGKYKERF